MGTQRLDPERDPRPERDDGTYGCYHEGCTDEADVAVPRRISSTGHDPVESIVTFCALHWLAWETLKATGNPLETALKIHGKVSEEFGTEGWPDARLYPRLLANVVLFDDPLGSNPPDEDSPLGDILDHAGHNGDRVRKKLDTPVHQQLTEYDVITPEDTDEVDLTQFMEGGDEQ